MINSYEFDETRFLVILYIINLHWRITVVDILRWTITTIDMPNRQTWAKYLGQAIDTKLGGLENKN